jgi:hypothetical protein
MRDFPQLRDINKNTKVVHVDIAKKFQKAIKASGRTGSKVFVGHAQYQYKDDGSVEATGLLLGRNADTLMRATDVNRAVMNVKGDVCLASCAGGNNADRAAEGQLHGYKRPGYIMLNASAPDSVTLPMSPLGGNQLVGSEMTTQRIEFKPRPPPNGWCRANELGRSSRPIGCHHGVRESALAGEDVVVKSWR